MSGIDELPKRYGGRRLAAQPDALGSLPVETTAAGIKALAVCESVRGVLEDQEVHGLTR